MTSSANYQQQTPIESESTKPLIPWRAFRIMAGLLTIYVGLRAAAAFFNWRCFLLR